MPALCLARIASRSAYDKMQRRFCQCSRKHEGRHHEYPYLEQLSNSHRAVAAKIKRDATMTTGAAWKSTAAGPNRILRWVMLLSDRQLKHYRIDMRKLKPQVVAKLRDKAATYEDCMAVAKKLTWLVYQMRGAPKANVSTTTYLEAHFGRLVRGTTSCVICRKQLPFKMFSRAMRGKAEIETGHKNPRLHNSDNVGFAHRECNIAQGNKTLPEFYVWIRQILDRVENTTIHNRDVRNH